MIYDYKSNNLVQEVILDCICPLIEDIIDEYSNLHRYEDISIYAPSWLTIEIICRLLDELDGTWVHEDSETEMLDVGNEMVITIGYDGMIFVESARCKDGTIVSNEGCTLTYIYDGFGRKDFKALKVNGESILVFGFEDDLNMSECDENHNECNDNTDLIIESDGDMHGFSVNRSDDNGTSSYSFYSTDRDLVEYMAKLLG